MMHPVKLHRIQSVGLITYVAGIVDEISRGVGWSAGLGSKNFEGRKMREGCCQVRNLNHSDLTHT